VRKRLYLCVAAMALSLAFSPASEGAQPPRNPGKSVLTDAANTFGIFDLWNVCLAGLARTTAPQGAWAAATRRLRPRRPAALPARSAPDDPCVRGHGPAG
jgi:hypothetical protein